ncbi:MAG: PKD domain-containing protein, partial [Limisphaerales bacterium]
MARDSWPCLVLLIASVLLSASPRIGGATVHVWLESPSPTPPYSTWETAAHVLQEAADAAEAGDTVLVTNGVYNSGGRIVQGGVANRVVIPAGVVVQSTSGPEVTFIEGAPAVAGNRNGNGDGAIRCVLLGRDATLVGFTLRNGHTRTNGVYDWDQSGGGAWCDTRAELVKCVLTGNAAHHMGGASFRADLVQCRVEGNLARYGGGVCLASASETVLSRNSAEFGGGAYLSRLTSCTVSDNSANIGGGAMGGAMLECHISRNIAGQWGGGVSQTSLQKCRVEENSAERGGGAFLANLFACVVTGNTADLGGGAAGGSLNHCTVTGNSAGSGGGCYLSSVSQSIVHFNEAIFGPNHEGATILQSCTTPLPESGSGNIDADPLLASVSHVSAESPCQATDVASPQLPTDADGEPWLVPSTMGADQFTASQATGLLEVGIHAPDTTVATGHAGLFRADINGRTTASEWDFGDGTIVRNRPWVRHAWSEPGDYRVTLTAYNDSFPDGIQSQIILRVVAQPVHYVSLATVRPTPPFASWENAAGTLQAAIDAATIPGSLILVTNGVYNRGGASLPGDGIVNRAVLTKAVVVRSVNGPEVTHIVGAGPMGNGAVRCVFVGRDAVLSGFTLTNGHTRTLGAPPREQRGAGLSGLPGGLVTNCVLTGNLARQHGGGAYRGTLVNCLLVQNQALDGGGGAYECRLVDCTLDSNKASNAGGGAARTTLDRCLVTANSAPLGAGASFGTLDECRIERNVTAGDGYGGGANGSLLRDCVLVGNLAYSGGGAYAANLIRCRLEANEARRDGGGATDSSLADCVLERNSATHGGGTSVCRVNQSVFTRNEARVAGGAADGGELEDSTFSENSAYYGGASERAVLRRCVLRGNNATFGGASYLDQLHNCLLTGNRADLQGGATFQGRMYHCTVTENASDGVGGGAFEGIHRNSILYFNTAPAGPDFLGSDLATCCTGPSPAVPVGNVTNPPAFLLPADGNYRLRSDSSCIDAGSDLSHLLADDLDGRLRPVDGDLDGFAAFDLGAYEYDPETADSNGDGIPDSWYLTHGLDAADPEVGGEDPDRDGMTTQYEWTAGTDPSDPDSALRLTVTDEPPMTILLQGVVGRRYTLLSREHPGLEESETNPWTPVPGQTDVPGLGELLALRDTPATSTRYYQVEVRGPDASIRKQQARTPSRGIVAVTAETEISRTTEALAPLALLPTATQPPPEGADPMPHPREPLPSSDWDESEPGPLTDVPASGTGVETESRRRLTLLSAPGSNPDSSRTNLHRFRIPPGGAIPISPLLRGQEPFMLYAASARIPTLEWGRGATFRGVAGGTDAETYHWKDVTSSSWPHDWSYHVEDPPVVTTLEWLEQARDYDAELVLTVNTRGHGHTRRNDAGNLAWFVDPESNSPEYLARLAADWVRYVNQIAPTHRLTPEGQLPPDLAETDPEADRILRELAALGNGTNAWRYRLATVADPDTAVDPPIERPLLSAADTPNPTRKVTFWEIGNEVETPMNASDPRGFRSMDPSINLTPAQYVERYLRITEAMKKVDPTIRVGPCPNNPWGPRAGRPRVPAIVSEWNPDWTIDRKS